MGTPIKGRSPTSRPLPDAVHHRLDTADADTLLRWSARVLTAPTLAAVFDDVERE